MLFPFGRTLITPGAIDAFERTGEQIQDHLSRHGRGDWGDLDDHDRQANVAALQTGDRLLSAYVLRDSTRVWIITEAEDDRGRRAATTILLPDEY